MSGWFCSPRGRDSAIEINRRPSDPGRKQNSAVPSGAEMGVAEKKECLFFCTVDAKFCNKLGQTVTLVPEM